MQDINKYITFAAVKEITEGAKPHKKHKNLVLTVTRVTQKKIFNMKTSLFFALMEIANANPAGFTVDAKTLQPITKGYAVAMAETQNSFNADGLERVIKFAEHNTKVNAFGGWYDSKGNNFYFDATVIVDDLEAAKELGRINGQLAIFDLYNMEEIRL